ncbi:Core-2/I-branching beta-1,6-N-acetylglucosaminyltransferase family protein isoform 2 [Hibiscus syriacus]|uniref:Core-2/I-branching beta-1,6-N-acetylglucosaminyltransferase family protein isoform 2 n=1 Tax=Hibiscus syriacus TaxID=106335 RepID=A0A6A2ZGE7_HIBSY|nr:Core-2/I-branching beta-1,6-N-acetylglucosaminyltransferase family protein isoform 2 [Hibiscus syriacus]
MGKSEHDRSRASPSSERTIRLVEPKIRSSLGIMRSRLQLLHRLLLPHQLFPHFRRVLRLTRPRRPRPQITVDQWRKGAQWFEIDRDLAIEVVSDQTYFPVFQQHCMDGCYADEHYLPTLVAMKFGEKNSNRSLTWVDWTKGGPHPTRFLRTVVTIEFLDKLRSGSQCEYNGKNTSICHLFARKFMPDALYRLLKFAPIVMQFH